MSSINQQAVYIDVPIPLLPTLPQQGTSPSPVRPHRKSTAQRQNSRSEQPSPSRQDKSITYTHPSEVAKDALISLLSQPSTDPRHKNDQICSDFVKYLDQCEQKGFMIKGYDTKKGKIINLPMSYNNRWGPVRRMELSQKLDRLDFWFNANSDKEITMITLTAAHPDEVAVNNAWFQLNKSRGKLIKLVKKYCGNPDYFWVCEPHPDKDAGYAHYHLAVFADVSNNVKDSQGRGMEDKLRDLWSTKYKTGSHTYGLDFSKNKEEVKSLKNYLVKYLRPGFLLGGWSIGTLIFNAHLWDNKFRLYGASKAISHMMSIKDESDNDIVWLETRLKTVELTPENEEVEIDRVIWYRQYIPDWIDNAFWLDIHGKIRQTDPPPIYFCDWGRPAREFGRKDIQPEPTKPQLTERQRRKLEQDGYL